MVTITVLHNELNRFINKDSGFSILIESNNTKILLDASHSNDFSINAKKAGINLKDLDYLVLSHGHWDHTGGIKFLYKIPLTVIAHPQCFQKRHRENRYVGSLLTKEEIENKFKTKFSKKPFWISKDILFLIGIPRTNDFECLKPIGVDAENKDDFVLDDSALVIKSERGLIIITGCGHSGICNTIEYSKKITKQDKILAVVGGFHLFDKNQTKKTVEYFKNNKIKKIYPMHCLDKYAFSEFKKIGAHKPKTLGQIIL